METLSALTIRDFILSIIFGAKYYALTQYFAPNKCIILKLYMRLIIEAVEVNYCIAKKKKEIFNKELRLHLRCGQNKKQQSLRFCILMITWYLEIKAIVKYKRIAMKIKLKI